MPDLTALAERPTVPSKLRSNTERYDSIQNRINLVKRAVLENPTLIIPQEYVNDEAYWSVVTNQFHSSSQILMKFIPNKDIRKKASLTIAVNGANETMKHKLDAAVDDLTKAWSRGALDNFIENLRNKQHREQQVGIFMIDIDHFKQINDMLGHTEGDNTLRKLVQIINTAIRGSDMVGRYGGEEFVVVIPGLPNEALIAIKAEEIREKVMNDPRLKDRRVTVSIGVTRIRPDDASLESIYRRADTNLYQAKNDGRNCSYDDNGKVVK